jgi:hypothetical protein
VLRERRATGSGLSMRFAQRGFNCAIATERCNPAPSVDAQPSNIVLLGGFLHNHLTDTAAIEMSVAATATFRIL